MQKHELAQQHSRRRDYQLGRRIAVGFGLVAVVATIMCAMLLAAVGRVSDIVMEMRGDELAIEKSHALATAVREQYAQQAHAIIEADRAHLDHYEHWVKQVLNTAQTLRPLVPVQERARLEEAVAKSRQLDAIFREQIMPALERGDRELVAKLHRTADQLSSVAATEADALAQALEMGMVHEHVSATHATQLGLLGGGVGISLVLVLSFGYTMHLRRAVLKPLAALAGAARSFGAGDYSARLGALGEGEFRALSEAFDHMAEAIEARERRMVLAERMAVVGQLAAGVAHEINNPIGIIRGYLKTMTPDSAPEVLQEELRILDEEAGACQRIAEDLLMYAAGSELRTEPTEMRAFLNEVVHRFEGTMSAKQWRFAVNAQAATAWVDPVRLRQLIFNLLRNATQAAPAASPIEIVGTNLRDDAYEIAIADRGPGVKSSDKPKIFEPFYSKTAGGSGLGLAGCESIARAHGGKITVEDNPGGGALFRVMVPGSGKPSPPA